MATDPKAESLVLSVSSMRDRLEEVLRKVTQEGERVVIEDGGRPQAVVIGIEDYRKMLAPAPEYLQRIWKAARESGLDQMSMDEIDAEIADARRESKAREGAA